jgi:hypothetical protein
MAKPNNCGKPKVLKVFLTFRERADFRLKKPLFLQKKRKILEKKEKNFHPSFCGKSEDFRKTGRI